MMDTKGTALAALHNAKKHLESSEVVLAYKAIERAMEAITEVRDAK